MKESRCQLFSEKRTENCKCALIGIEIMNNPHLIAVTDEAGTSRQPGRKRRISLLWWIMAFLSVLIALYGLSYVFLRERMFVGELAESFRARPWGIYTHAFLAAIALAVGPLQFHRGILARRRALHRTLGKIYVLSAMLGGGLCGLYMAIYSFGGWLTHLGFGALAALTFVTTLLAYLKIKDGQVAAHREWMIRNFALIFGAVTLRLWLPLLIVAYGGVFAPAYLWVAWLSWVPNLAFAEWYIRRSRQVQLSGKDSLIVGSAS